MKKKIFLISLFSFLLFFISNSKVSAQGTCSCTGPPSGSCTGVQTNNCETGFKPQCSSGQCIGNACTCVADSTLACGKAGQPCCTTGSQCNGGLKPLTTGMGCVCITQTPPPYTPPPTDSGGGGGKGADLHGSCGTTGINTAIGCISALESPEAFYGDLLRWGVGVGGGIAFLLIIYAGFMIMTSAGNPERLKAGQELLTSAISGLILLIFSIFALRFIGVDILGLNQFGFGQ